MEVALESYRGRFADIRTSLTRDVDLGVGLTEELLNELDTTKALLRQTKLDLDNECEARRRLQQEVQESRERQRRRPFVVALIDADADDYVFLDRFIANGAKGGEAAADALLAALQQYVRGEMNESDEVDILVRAFANVSGLGAALERDGRLKSASQLREFAAGFSSRQAFFDFVDVGPGKERADLKVRESIEFFLESFQCKHLVLGCGHDSGYAPFLGQFVGNRQVAERITLLEGNTFPPAIRDLGLTKTKFDSVFAKVTRPAPSAGSSGSVLRCAMPTVAGRPLELGNHSSNSMTTARGVPAKPEPPMKSYHNPLAQTSRLGPVLTNQSGRRVDRSLDVNQAVVERIKRGVLCFYLFLRGECVSPACARNHIHRPLTDEEFDALWSIARHGRCFKNRKADRDADNDCSDAMCVYGHSGVEQQSMGIPNAWFV